MATTPTGARTSAIVATVLSSKTLRYFLIAGWGLGLIPIVGVATAALWTLATLAAAHGRTLTERWLFTRNSAADPTRDPRFLAVAFVTTCFWAAAPLLAWFSGHPAAQPAAVLYIAAGFALVAAQFRGAPAIMISISAPYTLASLVMLTTVAGHGALALLAGFCALGAAVATQIYFAATIERKVGAAHRENARLVEQLRLSVDAMAAVPWDLDFRTGTLQGGDLMARVYGRAMHWPDVIVPGTTLVHPEDGAGVGETIKAMTPENPRGISEHRIIRADDGRTVWLRTAAIGAFSSKGALVRLSGLTYDISDQKRIEMEVLDATRAAEAAMVDKRQVFKTLGHELSDAASPPSAPDTRVSLAGLVSRLRAIVEEIGARGVALNELVDSLDKARAAAEAANLAKSQFLANMSHELRTPLNAILGYGEILLELAQERRSESDTKDLRRILAAANQLLHLINDVLDLSKIEAGRMDVSPAPFSVDLMLEDVVGTVTPMAAANRNTVTLAIDIGIGDACTDRFKLSQCVLNLAANAVKFTRGGDVRITARRETRSDGDWVAIEVADTGVGIAPEKLQNLFQPFVQADASVTRAFGGTGLGLAITRHLARLLGGDVTVESKPGEGSVFTLSAPATYRAPRLEAAA